MRQYSRRARRTGRSSHRSTGRNWKKGAVVLSASTAAALSGLSGIPFAAGPARAADVPSGGTLTLSASPNTSGLATQVYNVTPPNPETGFNSPTFLQTNTSLNGAAASAGTGGATVFYGAANTPNASNGQAFNAAPTAYGVTLSGNYQARFSGYFNAPVAGTYTFGLNSDDGSVIYIDGTQVVNDNAYQGESSTPPQKTGFVTLSPGAHEIVVGFYQGGGGAGVTAYYNPPAGAPNAGTTVAIPVNDGTNQLLTGPQAAVDFTTNGAPDPNVNVPAGTSGTLQVQYSLQSTLGTLSFNGGTSGLTLQGSAVRFKNTTFTGGGTVTLAPSAATVTGSNTAASPLVISAAGSTFAQDIALGQASDGGTAVTIVKTGYNNLLLDNVATAGGANSFVAGTTFSVQGGALVVNGSSTGSNPLGAAGVSLNAFAGAGPTANSTLTLASQGGNVTYDNPVTIAAGATANIIAQQANQQTGTGPQTGVAGITSPAAPAAFTVTLGGVNSLSVPGTSTLNLASANGETLALASAFNVATGGTLASTGGTVTLNGGTVAGTLTNSGATLNVSNASLTGAGAISQSGGTTNVSVANPAFTGSVTLSGGTMAQTVPNAFTAASVVSVNSGGTLNVNAAAANLANVKVASGGNLVLSQDQGGATPGTVPTNAVSGTVQVNANQSAGYNLTFSGGTLEAVNAARTYAGNVSASGNFTLGGAGQALTFNGILSGSANVTKAGTETVTLNGINTYAGSTTISTGTLKLGAAGALPAGTALAAGGTLDLNGFNQSLAGLTGAGTVTNSAATNSTLTLTGTASNFTGAVTDGGAGKSLAVVLAPNAAATFGGNASTYVGGTTVNSGARFVATSSSAAGTGAVTLSGGTLSVGTQAAPPAYLAGFGPTGGLNNTSNVQVNTNGVFTPAFSGTAPNTTLTMTTAVGSEATSAFFKSPVTFNNLSNATGFNANFVYNDTNKGGADGVTFTLQNDSRGATAIGGSGGGFGYSGITPSVSLQINIYTGANGGVGTAVNTNGGIGNTTANGSANTNNTTVTPVNLASGDPILVSLAYNGATNTLTETLTDQTTQATFTHAYTVNIASVLGTNTAYVGFTGGTGGVNANQTVSNFTLYSGISPLSAATLSNPLSIAAGTTGTVENNTGANNSNAVVLGPVSLGSAGTGATLAVTPGANLASGAAYSVTTGAVTLGGNSTINVANNGTGAGTLTLGAVSDGGSNFGLTKTGAGTAVMGGANTYTGPTAVSAGALLVNGSHTGGGNYSIASAATLGGTGTITLGAAAVVNITSGGTLAPGPGAAPGTLTVSGPAGNNANVVTLASGSNFQVFLTHAAASELLVNNGNITLGGANLVLQTDGSLTGGETFTIIDPPGSIAGQFANSTGTVGGFPYTVNYNTGSSPETVTLTVGVPEPASAGLLALGALGLLARRRRRPG